MLKKGAWRFSGAFEDVLSKIFGNAILLVDVPFTTLSMLLGTGTVVNSTAVPRPLLVIVSNSL